MYQALHISPMIPSFDIERTVEFFTDLFQFSVQLNADNYAVLVKDDVSVHILRAGSDIGEMEFYFEVQDIQPIWQSIKDKLKDIKVRAPFDRQYGMREFHIVIPQTKTLMFVGQKIN